jgi:hypothetical protein
MSLKKTIAEREKELAAIKGTQGDLDKYRADEEQKRLALENEVRNLTAMSNDYKKLQTDYVSYARQEDGVIGGGTIEEMALGKSYLDSFLSSKTVQTAFPGILDRIKRYDKAFELSGRNSALQDTIETLNKTKNFRTREEKIAFLQQKIAEAGSDNLTKVLLKSLIELMTG